MNAVDGKLDDLDDAAVKYDFVGGVKQNSITLAGGDPNAPVVISNVAAATLDHQAVNLGQLNSGLTQTLNQANAYTDMRFDQLSSEVGSVRSEARRAAAIGLAAASLRYDDRPGKLSVAAGGGYWKDEGALAFGAGYTSEDQRWRSTLSATTSGGDWGVGAGLSFTLN